MTTTTKFRNPIDRWILKHLENEDWEDVRNYFNRCDIEQLETIGVHLQIMQRSFDKHCSDLRSKSKNKP